LAYADVRELTGLVDDLVQCGDGTAAAHWRRAFDRSTKARARLLRAMRAADRLDQLIRQKLQDRGEVVLDPLDVTPDLGPEDDPA
jgi:hypothetical protein